MSGADNPATNNADSTEIGSAPRRGASKNLVLVRNLVGIVLVLSANPFWVLGAQRGLREWVGSVAFVIVVAGIFTGLLSLFFTKSQAPKWRRNFAITAWTLVVPLLIGLWSF